MSKEHRVMSDLRIVMVGKTGAGKSASANTILRREVFKEDFSSESVTTECQQHKLNVGGRNISVIDTPGLFDTSLSKQKLKEEIVRCVEMSLPGPHVFLLVIRLDLRLTEEEKNTVKWIQENFGEEATHYIIVLFTSGDQLEIPITEFLSKNKLFEDLVKQCKGGYHVFNNTDNENQLQVTNLLEKIDRMVMENRGQHYTNDMYKKAQRKIEEDEKRRQEEEERQRKEEEEKIRQDERRKVLNEAEEKRSKKTSTNIKSLLWKMAKNVGKKFKVEITTGPIIVFLLFFSGIKILNAALIGGTVVLARPAITYTKNKVKDYKKKTNGENNS